MKFIKIEECYPQYPRYPQTLPTAPMTEADAKAILKEMGITPTDQLVENWLRAQQAAEGTVEHGEGATEPGRSDRPSSRPSSQRTAETRQTPSSKSRLEPVLREAGQLAQRPGPKKPGRPRIIASWFEKVAQTMADGTSLKAALAMNGFSLSRSEVRACYRNRSLQAMYQEARRCYLAEHYGRRPSLRAVIGRYL